MEKELNIYGDVSGGWIFDQMDRFAHKYAISYIGDCVTATANIHYFRKPTIEDQNLKDAKIISTASFLFIKRK